MPKYNFHTVKKKKLLQVGGFFIFLFTRDSGENASRIMKNAAAKAREKCEK